VTAREGAVGEWVWLSDLLEVVERELGISTRAAAKVLRSELENLSIDAELPRLHADVARLFASQGLTIQYRSDAAPRVSQSGWQILTRNGRMHGRLHGWPVRVRWEQVVEALAHLRRTPIPITNAFPGLEPATRAKARRPAGLNYAKSDEPLVDEMKTLIESGEKSSAWQAALGLVGKARGGGGDQSRAKRLLRRFQMRFSPERDGGD
jgi:hypothetical protein